MMCKQIALRETAHKLDHNIGDTMGKIETLKCISTELGRISDEVDNTDLSDTTAMAMQFYDMQHKIIMVTELLRYTLNDLNETFEETQIIKESFFNLIVRNGKVEDGVSQYPFYEIIEEFVKYQEKNS